MLLKQLIELHRYQEERQVCSMPSWIGEERNRSLLHQWVQHDAIMSWWDSWLGPLASGHVLAPTVLLFHFFFSWKQCSRYLTAPWSPLPADLCEDFSSPCTSCRCWTLNVLLWSLSVLPSAVRTHTPSQHTQIPFPVFSVLEHKTTATFESFYSFGRGKRYTNSADLSSSCETSPSELQHKPPAKLFY